MEKKAIYKKCIISFVISFFGFVPILNILVILPISFYFAYSALRMSLRLERAAGLKAKLPLIASLFCLVNACVVWIIAFVMFILVSKGLV